MNSEVLTVRPGREGDLPAVAEIQAASPEAAQWNVRDYLDYEFTVACRGDEVAGFAVWRGLADCEIELLNLAVKPSMRRKGVARTLLFLLTASHGQSVWLEVRDSNLAARNLYKKLGFLEVTRRPEYYGSSGEGAIVMKFHS
ncbi:MAG: GNAT family N-acetyltransferase [Bryobacteraceae bacterium]